MNTGYRRMLGIVAALLALGALPTAALAGGQPSCGDTLTTNTTLTANLDCSAFVGNALTMGKNGITLNLNGKTITGPVAWEGNYGVDTNGYHRTTIRNGKINGYYIGVYVRESNRTLVQNIQMTGEDLDDFGVYVYAGVRNTLNLLKISGFETGVYGEYTARLKVTNSTLTANPSSSKALHLFRTSVATLSGNHLSAAYGAYEQQSHRSTYSGNTATGGIYGFYFDCGGYGQVTVTGNTATDASSAGFSLNECYTIEHPVDGYIGTRVVGNKSTESNYGFESYDSYNELWRNNVATDNDYDGFWFEEPSGYRIVRNTALRNEGNGFTLYENGGQSNVETISFNIARHNDHGFSATYAAPGDHNVSTNNAFSPACIRVDCD